MSDQKQEAQPKKKFTYPVKHPLQFPIETRDAQKLTELKLKRLTIGDLEYVSGEENRTTKSIKMLALSACLSEEDVRLLDYQDFEDGSDLVAEFMGF